MKNKKLSSVKILLVITLIAYLAASVLFCYTTKPAVTNGEFPFSITYEYKGETRTLSGVLECEFSGSDTLHGEHRRYWNVETIYENPDNVEEPFVVEHNAEEETTLCIYENMYAGYFMGDPLYRDYYEKYGHGSVQPSVSYYNYKTETFLEDATEDDIPASLGFKIVDFTYAEPIENDFSFSGIRYKADNVVIFIAILLVFFLLCLIFVRKDKAYQYSSLDKAGVGLNFLVGIIVVPFVSFFCMLYGIVESHIELINQIVYNIPPFMILCLALSVVFRRKGYSKAGFIIQFGGLLPIVLVLVLGVLL